MTKVGKRLPDGSVYVQKDAIYHGNSNLTQRELELFQKATSGLGNGENDYDFVQLNANKKQVRLMQMSDLWAEHPFVLDSVIINPDTGATTKGKSTGQIYHRLDTMIDPSHPSYQFHKAVTEWEEAEGLIGKSAPRNIGYPQHWRKWVEEHMPLHIYEKVIDDIRKETAHVKGTA